VNRRRSSKAGATADSHPPQSLKMNIHAFQGFS